MKKYFDKILFELYSKEYTRVGKQPSNQLEALKNENQNVFWP